MRRRKTTLIAVAFVAVGFVLGTVALVSASSKATVKGPLAPTSALTGASGKTRLSLHTRKHKGALGTRGNFSVSARQLAPNTSYDLIVGGAKVGALHTNRGGNGSASFGTAPRGKKALLGVDPRGKTVLLRDPAGSGTDVLVGTISDDTTGSQACCTTDSEGETECEDVDPDPVTGALTCNGTIPTDATGAPITSCLPDPCNASEPPPNPPSGPGTTTVCCILDSHDAEASQTECEDSLGECAGNGGALVQVQLPATFVEGDNPCDLTPDPCQSVPGTPPPPGSPPSLCCVPQTGSDPGESEPPDCEDLSADACAAIGGTQPTNGACDYTDPSGVPAPVPCL